MTYIEKIERLKEIKEILTKEFSLNELDALLTDDILWLYDNLALISHEGEILGISFDIDVPPSLAADIVQTLDRNKIEIEIFESYHFSVNGDMIWGDRVWEVKDKELREHYCS